jgi:aldehyde:ferredoxin oxidoreductase
MHVKGLGLGGHDPRIYNGMACNYATANRGAHHMEGQTHLYELLLSIVSDRGLVDADQTIPKIQIASDLRRFTGHPLDYWFLLFIKPGTDLVKRVD